MTANDTLTIQVSKLDGAATPITYLNTPFLYSINYLMYSAVHYDFGYVPK